MVKTGENFHFEAYDAIEYEYIVDFINFVNLRSFKINQAGKF